MSSQTLNSGDIQASTGAAGKSVQDAEVKAQLNAVKGVVGMSAIKDGWAKYSEVYAWITFDVGTQVYWSVAYVLFLPLVMVWFAELSACPYATNANLDWTVYEHGNGTSPRVSAFTSTCQAVDGGVGRMTGTDFTDRSFKGRACWPSDDSYGTANWASKRTSSPDVCEVQDGAWKTMMNCTGFEDSRYAFSMLNNHTSNTTMWGSTATYRTEVDIDLVDLQLLGDARTLFSHGNYTDADIATAAVTEFSSEWRFSLDVLNPKMFKNITFGLAPVAPVCMACDMGYYCVPDAAREEYTLGYTCDGGFYRGNGARCSCPDTNLGGDVDSLCYGQQADEISFRSMFNLQLQYPKPCLVEFSRNSLRLAWEASDWVYGSSAVTLLGYKLDTTTGEVTHRLNQTVSIRIEPSKCFGRVWFGAFQVEAISFAGYTFSISVGSQALLMISLSGIGDHENYRKHILVGSSYLGAIFLLCLQGVRFVGPYYAYVVAGVTVILSNGFIGLSVVMYNAYLPFIAVAHPKVRKKSKETKDPAVFLKTYLEVTDELSHQGFAAGYMSGFFTVVIAAMFLLSASSLLDSYLNVLLFCAIYWFVLTIPFQFYVKERPGVPFPKEWTKYGLFSMMGFGWYDSYKIATQIQTIPHTAKFLLAFFMFSDGYNTIASSFVLYASNELDMKMTQLIIVNMLVTFFAGFGTYLQMKMQKHPRFANWDSLSFVKLNLFGLVAVTIYANMGHIPGLQTLVSPTEFYLLVPFFGMALGPIQSFSRVVMTELCPPSLEAEFFGIYEITDKGSGWIGPLVTAIAVQNYGSVRYMFPYLIICQVVPLFILHFYVDLDKGRKDCMSIKVMQWAKARRKGKAKRAKKEKRRKDRMRKTSKVTSSMASSSSASQSGASESGASGMSGYLPSAGNSSVASAVSGASEAEEPEYSVVSETPDADNADETEETDDATESVVDVSTVDDTDIAGFDDDEDETEQVEDEEDEEDETEQVMDDEDKTEQV